MTEHKKNCGACDKWMKCTCPAEHNVKGQHTGPSCSGSPCTDFEWAPHYQPKPEAKPERRKGKNKLIAKDGKITCVPVETKPEPSCQHTIEELEANDDCPCCLHERIDCLEAMLESAKGKYNAVIDALNDRIDRLEAENKRLLEVFDRWGHIIDPETNPGGCANCFWTDRKGRLEAELEEKRSALRQVITIADSYRLDAERLETKNKQLQEVLKKYGQHNTNCGQHPNNGEWGVEPYSCTCGFAEVLKGE